MKKGFLNGSPFGSVEKAKTGAKKVDKEAAEKAAWPWPKDDPNEWSGSGLTKAEKDEMRAERRRVREFVMKVPLQRLEALKPLMIHPNGQRVINPGDNSIIMPDERSYPHIKRIYDTAATDKKVCREAGEAINQIGGFALMQGCFHMLSAASALSRHGWETGDMAMARWFYQTLQSEWDGIGMWMA